MSCFLLVDTGSMLTLRMEAVAAVESCNDGAGCVALLCHDDDLLKERFVLSLGIIPGPYRGCGLN